MTTFDRTTNEHAHGRAAGRPDGRSRSSRRSIVLVGLGTVWIVVGLEPTVVGAVASPLTSAGTRDPGARVAAPDPMAPLAERAVDSP